MLKLKKVRRSLESRIKGSEREKVRVLTYIEEGSLRYRGSPKRFTLLVCPKIPSFF